MTDLIERYVAWLEAQVRHADATPRGRTYHDLCGIMHSTEFVWLVLGDDNRIADGLNIRAEFLRDVPALYIIDMGPCSVLEVLIGLSRRLSWQLGHSNEVWAWQLLTNLNLHRYSDTLTKGKRRKAQELLTELVWRTYLPDGMGGFFPLQYPPEDQTKVELWYQMNQWMEELDL